MQPDGSSRFLRSPLARVASHGPSPAWVDQRWCRLAGMAQCRGHGHVVWGHWSFPGPGPVARKVPEPGATMPAIAPAAVTIARATGHRPAGPTSAQPGRHREGNRWGRPARYPSTHRRLLWVQPRLLFSANPPIKPPSGPPAQRPPAWPAPFVSSCRSRPQPRSHSLKASSAGLGHATGRRNTRRASWPARLPVAARHMPIGQPRAPGGARKTNQDSLCLVVTVGAWTVVKHPN